MTGIFEKLYGLLLEHGRGEHLDEGEQDEVDTRVSEDDQLHHVEVHVLQGVDDNGAGEAEDKLGRPGEEVTDRSDCVLSLAPADQI